MLSKPRTVQVDVKRDSKQERVGCVRAHKKIPVTRTINPDMVPSQSAAIKVLSGHIASDRYRKICTR